MNTFEEMSKNLPKEWWKKLEEASQREFLNKKIYDRHYSDKMSYHRFKYIQFLESEIVMGYSCYERAIESLNKYDENHPTERFN